MKTLIISRSEVAQLLDHKIAAKAVREAYITFNAGRAELLPIQSLDIREHNGETDFKSGYDKDNAVICTKIASGFWDNPKNFGLPTGLALVSLIDARNGVPISVMDGTLITGYRTAAAGALAASILARPDSANVAVIGTGTQAQMQTLALAGFFNLSRVRVWGIEGIDRYIAAISEKLPGVEVVSAATAQEAVHDADIVITATPSTKALVMAEWVKPGTHINAIGSDTPGKQELDPMLFKSALVVNDSIAECVRRGETQHSIAQGIIRREDIYAEIGEILSGQKSGRTSPGQLTIFDTTGLSILDISTALAIYRAAKEQGIGYELELI